MKRSMAILLGGAIALSTYTAMPVSTSAAVTQQASLGVGSIEAGVNMRSKPSMSGEVIGFLSKGTVVQVLDKANSYFYKVQTAAGQTGYVSAAPKYITINQSVVAAPVENWNATVIYGVNLRTKPSTSGSVIGMLKKGTRVNILEKSNNYFYKVTTETGLTGYVSTSSKYLQISGGQAGSGNDSNNANQGQVPSSSAQQKILAVIETGKKYMGTPYEFGSNRSTTVTFDCSDFVRHIYKETLGITLPADSRKQGAWVKANSQAVYDINSLKTGDLVFFMSYKGSSASAYAGIDPDKERITHVALYLGNGQILHTYSNKSGGVRIDTLSGSWERRFLYGGSVVQ